MYRLGIVNPEVIINLDNGVYEFRSKSATGKTFLLNMIKNASFLEPVVGYTLSDHARGLISYDECINCKVIMFDRYDMYAGAYKNIILDCMKNSIVLIDNKVYDKLNIDVTICNVRLSVNKIEVL